MTDPARQAYLEIVRRDCQDLSHDALVAKCILLENTLLTYFEIQFETDKELLRLQQQLNALTHETTPTL